MADRVRRRARPLRQRRQPRFRGALGADWQAAWNTVSLLGLLPALPWAGPAAISARAEFRGAGDLSTFAVTPDGRYAPGAWHVEGADGGAWNDASISRNIVFPGVSRHANGSPQGSAFCLRPRPASACTSMQMRVTPFARYRLAFDQDAFTETRAGDYLPSRSSDSTSSAHGALGTSSPIDAGGPCGAPRNQRARRLGAGVRRH